MGMKEVKLDIFELGYLLDACLRGSHLRSGTIRRFVDEWYDILNPTEANATFRVDNPTSHTMNVGTARKKTTNRTSNQIAVAVARI